MIDSQPMRYFARVTAGTEALAGLELDRLPALERLATQRRHIDFHYGGDPRDLLALRSVDDVGLMWGHCPAWIRPVGFRL